MFSHQRLKVYDKALASVANLARRSASWDKRHSVVDQLLRASESIILNVAEGARLWSAGHKQHSLDYAIGSALESAACLDIAVLKQCLLPDAAQSEKRLLCEIVKMLVGLRKSWGEAALHEDSRPYDDHPVALFPHERLDRRSFLDIAECSAVKAAAFLDLCVHKTELEPCQRDWGVQLLGRISLMLRGLSPR